MAPELAHKERPVLHIIVGPVCRHDIGRTRTGAGHAADLRGDQGPDRVGPARSRRPAALHPVPGGGVGCLADDGDGGLRATDRGGVSGNPARSPGAGRARAHSSGDATGAAHPFGSSGPAVRHTANAWPTSRHRPGPAGNGSRRTSATETWRAPTSPGSPGGRRSPPPCCAVGHASATATRAARLTSGRLSRATCGEPAGCAASRTRSSW